MASFVPVDYDPFAASQGSADMPAQPASDLRLIPVDHDPFAAPPSGFATRAQREGSESEVRRAEFLADAVRIRQQQDRGGIIGNVDAAVRGAAGWIPGMDKLAAAGDAAFGQGTGESFGERYSDNLERQRAMDDADRMVNPNARLAGQVAGFVPTAMVMPGVNVVKQGARGATALNAAATGGVYGVISGAVESDGDLADKAAAAAQVGGAGVVLGGALGATIGAVSNRLGRQPAPVPEGVQAADDLGIRLTQGQRSGDVGALSRENAMAGGAYGDRAQRVAQDAIAEQRGQVLAARDRIGATASRGQVDLARPADAGGIVGEAVDDFASRARSTYEAKQARLTRTVQEAADTMSGRFNPRGLSPVDAGEIVAGSTRNAAARGKLGYQQAYRDAFAKEGQVAPEFFTGVNKPGSQGLMAAGSPLNEFAAPISRRIEESLLLRAEPIIPDAATTPVAARALKDVDRIANLNLGRIGSPGLGENVAGVNLRGIEQARRILLSSYKDAKASPADARAMRGIVEAFDEQLERAFATSLFSGDDAALGALKDARGAYSTWMRTFRPQGAGDDAGRAIQRIVDRGATDEEVANFLIGASRVGEAGLSARLYDRLGELLGRNSSELAAIRGAAWHKLTGGFDVTDPKSALKIAERVGEFTGERGRTLAGKMFSGEEVTAMQRYASALRMFAARAKANPDNPEAQSAVKLLMDISEKRMSPEDLSSAIFGFGNKSSTMNLRLVDAIGDLIGKEGPEWAAIRQGVWQRIADVPEGMTQMGAQKMSQRILQFVGGEGQSLATRLFSSQEIGQMRKLAAALKQTVPPPGTTNHPNSGNRAAGQMREVAKRTAEALLTTLGATMGGWQGAMLGLAGGKGLGTVAGMNAARQARGLYYAGAPTPIAPRLAERLGVAGKVAPRSIGISVPGDVSVRGSAPGYLPAAADHDER
ncbi:hypothetical protein [Bosea sp. NPDC055594]